MVSAHCGNGSGDGDGDCDGDGSSYGSGYGDGYGNSSGDGYSDGYGYSNGNGDSSGDNNNYYLKELSIPDYLLPLFTPVTEQSFKLALALVSAETEEQRDLVICIAELAKDFYNNNE